MAVDVAVVRHGRKELIATHTNASGHTRMDRRWLRGIDGEASIRVSLKAREGSGRLLGGETDGSGRAVTRAYK